MLRKTPAVVLLGLLLSHPIVARADVVLDWNEILVNTLEGQNPLVAARVAAITHTAVFEAVNAITGEYHSYLFTIEASPEASPYAAAVAAAHAVLVHFFPDAARVEALNAFRDNSLAAIPDGPSKTAGIAAGQAAAAAIIAARANDGSGMPAFFLPPRPALGNGRSPPRAHLREACSSTRRTSRRSASRAAVNSVRLRHQPSPATRMQGLRGGEDGRGRR